MCRYQSSNKPYRGNCTCNHEDVSFASYRRGTIAFRRARRAFPVTQQERHLITTAHRMGRIDSRAATLDDTVPAVRRQAHFNAAGDLFKSQLIADAVVNDSASHLLTRMFWRVLDNGTF
jgi:hypothetical protein